MPQAPTHTRIHRHVLVAYFDIGDTLVASDGTWMSGARTALERLRGRGIRLGLISNTGELSRQQVLARLPYDFNPEWFNPDLVLFSSEVGIEKPDPRIFQMAIARAGANATECLFCTGNPLHLDAAGGEGLVTMPTPMTTLVRRLDARGLLPPSRSPGVVH